MKTGILFTIIGVATTIAIGGITLMPNESAPVRTFGIVLITSSILALSLTIIYVRIQSMNKRSMETSERLIGMIDNYTNRLETIANKIGLPNDARFIPDGFIGLQRQAILLESNSDIGPDKVRMTVMGHLPSYMRWDSLTDKTGDALYHNWEPPHYIPEYINLVNQRSKAFKTFVEKGGIVREIYEKDKIQQYVAQGFTFHDRLVDPIEEIEERLRALLRYLNYPNYYICLLESEIDRPGHHFLLKSNVGLVLDLRTTDIQRHFTQSLEGLFTESKSTLDQFERRFAATWKQTDKSEVRIFIEDLLRQLKHTSKDGGK